MKNLQTFFIITPLLVAISFCYFLPWWSFSVVLILVGVIIRRLGWDIASFTVGFASGLIVWMGAQTLFDINFNGILLNKVASFVSITKPFLFVLTGLLGGLVSGFALSSGYQLLKSKKGD
ncbi:hypothetical protein [Sphingobacterium kitahiroshimense]|uniref:Uncharacterized protein n=1 Tax=Sphingobacterium kitahiroshimense TaxID=470446 RepID=A0ABV0BMM6_9SPHI